MEEENILFAEFFIERIDYGSPVDEYSYLYFGCTVNNKRVLFVPETTNSADGIYVDGVALSSQILGCDQQEIDAVTEVFISNERLIAVYYEICVYGHQGYPHPRNILEKILQLDLTEWEKAKIEEVLSEYTQIYLIKDNKTGYIKIGRSGNPEYRLKQLIHQDTLMPEANNFTLLFAWDDHFFREKHLHKHFANKRIRGEWFALTNEDITKIHKEFVERDYS